MPGWAVEVALDPPQRVVDRRHVPVEYLGDLAVARRHQDLRDLDVEGVRRSNRVLNKASLESIRSTLHEYGTGQAYQNYADASLPNPQRAYYGTNLPRLVEIKNRYDPANVFKQPQGIPRS
jgi:hypothetical protein